MCPENFIAIWWYLLKFSHAMTKTHLLNCLVNGLMTNRHKNWYDPMTYTTENAPKVSTPSFYPCARESSLISCSKTDRHTDVLSKTTIVDVLMFLMVAHPKSGLISNSIFALWQHFHGIWKCKTHLRKFLEFLEECFRDFFRNHKKFAHLQSSFAYEVERLL